MLWGDFFSEGNTAALRPVLRYQKRFASLVGERGGFYGFYHADPLLAEHGMLKVGDLYKQ